MRGREVPRLGFGTWQITGPECGEAVRDALELGYRHVDTARAYDNEREVGAGLHASGVPREDVWITTKVWMDDLAPRAVRASCEGSLERLGVESVDLLLVHWPNPRVPLADTLGAMVALQEEGLIGLLGVSNFPPALLREALALAPVASDQVEFHPFLGQDELLAIARAEDIAVTAYAPLAQGAAVRDPTLREIAAAHGRTPAQVALRWLLDQDPRVLVVPKAASADRRRENLGVDFALSEDDHARIAALPKDRRDFDPGWAPDWEG